jgi:hypothetical protein
VRRALLRTAEDLETMGDAKYGNGLAIIAIHVAIAYTDALTVAYREIRSTDGDHTRSVDALQFALGQGAPADQVQRLRGILNAKSHASYSGNYYTLQDGANILRESRLYAA